ncbi:chromosomal replication initiator protein DnaA [Patescibacteria group bacterium]|nr:chromosomal replication initiator protein DnaA [Patescibacteria group bacterium]
MENDQIWQAVLGELELTISKANFTTWFKSTCIVDNEDGEFVIGVPNGFTQEWLQNKYHKQISTILQNITGIRVKKIDYKLGATQKTAAEKEEGPLPKQDDSKKFFEKTSPQNTASVSISQSTSNEQNDLNLNPKYNFESFVVGPSNELARAAAAAVAQTPGTVYNPLFIYGGVGLGKTHLVQAIGNKITIKNPNAKIIYVTCEKFTDDFINFIRNERGKAGNSSTFKSKYRSADILIVDDIQFLSGKESTQDEFFHTFNTLHQNNKQVLLTSDRPPKAIATLTDRLTSRFEGGMVADISLPDQETRKAILENKCRERGVKIPHEVLAYIAENIQNNIRELEGALSRLIAHCQLNNTPPSEELAKSILTNINSSPKSKAITPKRIVDIVSVFYDVNQEQLIAKNRKKEIAWPRQIAMFLMREESKTSYPSIGQELGGRDHTTAMHAYEKVSRSIENDDNLRQEIDLIRQKIYTSLEQEV